MSVTITGGISFSGGVSMVAAPPSTPTAGWFAGGDPFPGGTPVFSRVDRITYATDTATATVRGPITAAGDAYGTGTLDYGYIKTSGTAFINRITYATDTSTASAKGSSTGGRYGAASTDNTTYGWFGGGYGPAISTVQRLVYATDTDATTTRGPLSLARYNLAATGTPSYGWFGGGQTAPSSPSTNKSIIDRIDYSNDTAIASVRGPLSGTTYILSSRLAATGDNATYGWYGPGRNTIGNATVSALARITYANDTIATSVRGPILQYGYSSAASTDTVYGWFAAGTNYNGPLQTSVNRITFANDTATSSDRGPVTLARQSLSGTSGLQ
jgi:hypothetical protein